MLCYQHSEMGNICTNRCEKKQDCKTEKIPLLIEALDILSTEETGESERTISFNSYCIASEAYINNIAFDLHSQELIKTTNVSCFYPHCSESFLMTVAQKEELLTENYLKYGKHTYLYCSKACKENHLKDLSGSKFLLKGTLKNHDFALVVHNVDTTKRFKEKEVHTIVGNITEQRARLLREKLISVGFRDKRKYLTSKEVQEFLLNDLQGELKATQKGIIVAAYDVMNKTMQLFPNTISIGRIKKRTRYIEYIE